MITKRMQEYIDYSLAHPELRDADISRATGIAKKTISNWKNKENFAEFREYYDQALRIQWKSYTKEAQKVLHALLYSDRQDVALNACKYLLSSNGYDAAQNVNVNAEVKNINIEVIDD